MQPIHPTRSNVPTKNDDCSCEHTPYRVPMDKRFYGRWITSRHLQNMLDNQHLPKVVGTFGWRYLR